MCCGVLLPTYYRSVLTRSVLRVRPSHDEEDREAARDHGEGQQPHLRLVPDHDVVHIPEKHPSQFREMQLWIRLERDLQSNSSLDSLWAFLN